MSVEIYAREALRNIPQILTQLDRNPHSPTYGCFDRNFWHYKILDFPSGMSQEFVWPVALAYQADLPYNSFYQQPALRDWCEAAILFAARSAHSDGSCDDYYPYERAGGAGAFSLLACLETYNLLGFDNAEMLEFFRKRATWLAHHEESGRLTNHHALIVLCLELAGRLLQTEEWAESKTKRLRKVLQWQHSEGWFPEYEGCDPGYHTMTLSCLARLHELEPDERLKQAIERAVSLASEFIHPDGSYAGEYASRNTYNFFPHGFELAGKWLPEALEISDRFLTGLRAGLGPCYSDDHIIGHHSWNYLLAWRDAVPQRPDRNPRPQGRTWLRGANILIDRREDCELYIALNKGGVFKIFRHGSLAASDTHLSLRVRNEGALRNAVGHIISDYDVSVEQDLITISGHLHWAKQKEMTPMRMLILRAVMLTGGRFFPDLIRKLLQTILITGAKKTPYTFRREFRWINGAWEITDTLDGEGWDVVEAAGIGGSQTSIYNVMSRTFQAGQLQPWFDITDDIRKLQPGHPYTLKRLL